MSFFFSICVALRHLHSFPTRRSSDLFDAIKMDTEFELSNTDRFGGLLFDKHRLARSNEYYHRIHPAEAAEVDSHLAAEKAKVEARTKADAEAKARAAAAKAAAPPTPKPAPAAATH